MKQKLQGRTWKLLTGVILLILGVVLIVACSKDSAPQEVGTVPTTVVAPSDPNGEGVRPDVRAYIETTYPNSAKTRAALFQYAKVTELALADANNKQLSIQHATEVDRANTCLWYVRDLTDDARSISRALMLVILNTDGRNKAYITYNEQLGGEIFPGIPYDQRASACSINPATLPN